MHLEARLIQFLWLVTAIGAQNPGDKAKSRKRIHSTRSTKKPHHATIEKVRVISECEEYAKLVYADEQNPTLHVNSQTHSISKCGVVAVPLIIGGVKASENEFPHMVRSIKNIYVRELPTTTSL